MKTFYLKTTIILALFALSLVSKAQVFVDGIVYDYVDDDQPIQVTVMEDDQFYKSIETSKGGKFRLRLEPNHYYEINLSKPDYYITKIAVDTDLPFAPGPEFFTEIPLEADLVRKYVDMDPEVMKKPLSIFSYDPASGTFVQDDDHLQKARAQLDAFLYEVEEAKKKDQEELATETPEKSPEDTNNLNQEIDDSDKVANNRNQSSPKNATTEISIDTTQLAENKSTEKNNTNKPKNNKQETNDNRKRVSNNISGNSSGPLASQEDTPTTVQDTAPVDTTETILQSDSQTEAEEKSYSISIKINGKTYNPNLNKPLEVDNELDIEIAGIPSDDYSAFRYRLKGKDNNFKNLEDDEIEYDKLEKGNYTFILSNISNNFEDIHVPINIIEEESDFPWLLVILGIAVVVLIIVIVNRRKSSEEDDDIYVDGEKRDIDDRNDLNDRT